MAARKKVKKQTLAEFQAWLEGVEEISGSDWVPSKEQWTMIRTRINNISDEPVHIVTEAVSGNIANPNNPYPQVQPRAPGATPPPSEFIPQAPAPPSSFDRAGMAPGGAPPQAGIPPGPAGPVNALGIPTGTAFAQPGPNGLAKTAAPAGGHKTDGAAFE